MAFDKRRLAWEYVSKNNLQKERWLSLIEKYAVDFVLISRRETFAYFSNSWPICGEAIIDLTNFGGEGTVGTRLVHYSGNSDDVVR